MTARIADIIALASRLSCVPVADLLGKSRLKLHTPTRFAICMVAREHGHSYPQIGKRINRDHSTVIHAVDRAEYMFVRDPDFAVFVMDLRHLVKVTPPFVPGAPLPKPVTRKPVHAWLPVQPVVIAEPLPVIVTRPVAKKPRNVFEFTGADRNECAGMASRRNMVDGSRKLLQALRVMAIAPGAEM